MGVRFRYRLNNLTWSTAQTFSKDSIKEAPTELRDSMYEVGKSALELETEQAERLQRKAEEDRRLREQGEAPEPVKRNRKKGEASDDPTDDTEADIDYYPGLDNQPTKRQRKTVSLASLLQPDNKEYRTTAADREERMKERQKLQNMEVPDSTANVEETEGAEAEMDTEKEQLQREIEQQQRELRKLERRQKQEAEQSSRHKAKEFQQMITKGTWLKERDRTPRIVSAEKRKKTAGFTSQKIKMDDEEEEEEDEPPLPEGFHLLQDDIHCKNIRKAEGFQHYMRAICNDFEPIVRKGVNIATNYTKLVRSVFWAGRAVGITSMQDADVEEVMASIKDQNCRAWMLSLCGITEATQQELLPAGQRESFTVSAPSLDPDIEKMLNEEVAEMTPTKECAIRNTIKQLCHHNKLAHRHASMASEQLETLSMNVSIPFFLRVAESTARPLVQLRLTSMDAHMDKTEQARKAREEEYATQIQPTLQLAVKQNLASMKEEWKDSKDGRANRILAAFVNRYVYEQMFIKSGKVQRH